VLGEVDGWRSGLAEAGVEILADTAASQADLVVTPAARAREAVRSGAPMIVLEGRLPRSLLSVAERPRRKAGRNGR
jgi:hypothetical protein